MYEFACINECNVSKLSSREILLHDLLYIYLISLCFLLYYYTEFNLHLTDSSIRKVLFKTGQLELVSANL